MLAETAARPAPKFPFGSGVTGGGCQKLKVRDTCTMRGPLPHLTITQCSQQIQSGLSSEIEADADLDLAFWKSRCKAQRLAGGEGCCSVYAEWRRKGSSDDVVHTRIVCPVGEVESFRDELKLVPVGERDQTAHPHIEADVVRSKPAIPSGAGRTVVGEMI